MKTMRRGKNIRWARPCCGSCGHPGYSQGEASYDKRPQFKCDSCGHTWTCGKDGGEYVLRKK